MTFTFKGATITARELTIGDDNEIDLLCFRLGDNTSMYNATKWAEFVVGAVIQDGDRPVPYVTSRDTPEEARASFALWERMPRSFVQNWKAELRSAEASLKE